MRIYTEPSVYIPEDKCHVVYISTSLVNNVSGCIYRLDSVMEISAILSCLTQMHRKVLISTTYAIVQVCAHID